MIHRYCSGNISHVPRSVKVIKLEIEFLATIERISDLLIFCYIVNINIC